MNSNYNIEEWDAVTTIGRRIFNYNFRLTASEFKGWSLIKTAALTSTKDITSTAYFFENNKRKGKEIMRIDVTENNSWKLAQTSLHTDLTESMRANIAQATKDLNEVGDICFVTRLSESDLAAAILFGRGNITITMHCVSEVNFDLSEFAVQLDDILRKEPSGVRIKKEKVKIIKPGTSNKKGANSYSIISILPEIIKSKITLQIIASDGELSRKDKSVIYSPDEIGEHEVQIFALKR